jgi:hypothetical protein
VAHFLHPGSLTSLVSTPALYEALIPFPDAIRPSCLELRLPYLPSDEKDLCKAVCLSLATRGTLGRLRGGVALQVSSRARLSSRVNVVAVSRCVNHLQCTAGNKLTGSPHVM